MILLFNPLSTTPGKQPLPLSVMSLAAVLEGKEAWSLVDGNLVAGGFDAPPNGRRAGDDFHIGRE